jgi:hypothetical protein
MKGYALCLDPGQSTPGYQYIRENRDKLVPFDFEESSIDLASITTPRIVVNDICYQIERQYFVRVSDTDTERIIICKPILAAAENPNLVGHDKVGTRYNGLDSYTYNKFLEKKAAEETAKKEEEKNEESGKDSETNKDSGSNTGSAGTSTENMTVNEL